MTTPAIELKRHYRKLSEKQTDELAGAVADLIVGFIKSRGCRPAAEPPSEAVCIASNQGESKHDWNEKH